MIPRCFHASKKLPRTLFLSLMILLFGGRMRTRQFMVSYSVTVQYSKFGCPLLLRVKPFTRSETSAVAT